MPSGEFRAKLLITWYDESPKYVLEMVDYDEDVSDIIYLEQELLLINIKDYHLFDGYGAGECVASKLFEKYGARLGQIKK